MRKHGKVDSNQFEIVQALRQSGCSVQILSSVGGGCPDLLAGRNGVNILLECKSSPNAKLTPDEQKFFDTWKGKAVIVRDVDEALAVMNEVVGSRKRRENA